MNIKKTLLFCIVFLFYSLAAQNITEQSSPTKPRISLGINAGHTFYSGNECRGDTVYYRYPSGKIQIITSPDGKDSFEVVRNLTFQNTLRGIIRTYTRNVDVYVFRESNIYYSAGYTAGQDYLESISNWGDHIVEGGPLVAFIGVHSDYHDSDAYGYGVLTDSIQVSDYCQSDRSCITNDPHTYGILPISQAS
ncbi:MAG: hypothetical protein ACI83D_000497 [Planctomycetota bacterium]|jgi:hypothetical protein